MSLTKRNKNTAENVWAPMMVVYPGETVLQAMKRHRRDTGHPGHLIVMGINRNTSPNHHVHAGVLGGAVPA